MPRRCLWHMPRLSHGILFVFFFASGGALYLKEVLEMPGLRPGIHHIGASTMFPHAVLVFKRFSRSWKKFFDEFT